MFTHGFQCLHAYISVDAMVKQVKVFKLTCRRNTSIDVDEGGRSADMHVLIRRGCLLMASVDAMVEQVKVFKLTCRRNTSIEG